METDRHLTGLLDDLIQINKDRITGYEKAIGQLLPEHGHLRQLFGKYISESNECVDELSNLREKFIAEKNGDEQPANIYRTWIDVKPDRGYGANRSILDICEFGEEAVQSVYQQALEVAFDIPPSLRQVIQQQQSLLYESKWELQSQRDNAAR